MSEADADPARRHAPSAERNRHEILPVLLPVLPRRGTILEVASGTGQHAVHFAPHVPEATWQPSDVDPRALTSIRAWIAESGVPNVAEPVELDLTSAEWPIERAEAMVAINCLHVSPWAACEGLMAGAARTLETGAPLFVYGAMFRDDVETAPSNLAFDRDLRERDPAWGVRRLEDVLALAEAAGLSLERIVDMPNNNTALVLRRR